MAAATPLAEAIRKDIPSGVFTPRTTVRASLRVGRLLTFALGVRSLRASSFVELASEQMPLQYMYLVSQTGRCVGGGDPRALALGASLLGVACGLVGMVGHFVVIELAACILSSTLVVLCVILVAIEAEGGAAAELGGALLGRLPSIASAKGRARWYGGAAVLGALSGPPVLGLVCAPPLLLAAALDFTAHIAAAPALRRLESELPDADAARRRFANADVERSGRLVGGALSRLSVAVQPGSSALLRGVSMALCPLGGHAVTAEGLAHWRSARAESTPHRGKGSTGEEEEAAVVGGDAQEGGGSEGDGAAISPEALAQLLAGPPGGGWAAHQAAGSVALSAALLCISAAISVVAGLPAIWTNRAPLLLFTLALPSAAVLAVSLHCLSIDLLAVCTGAPCSSIEARARPLALAALSAWPPMTLSTARAAVLLVDGAALWQALPPAGDGLLPAPLAMLIGLALLWSVFFAGAALWLAEQSGAERQLVEVLNPIDVERWALQGGSELVWPGEKAIYKDACIALDMRRRGVVAPEDVRRFYGTAMFGEDSWG